MHQSRDDRSSDTFGNYSWEWSVRLVICYRPSILFELSFSYRSKNVDNTVFDATINNLENQFSSAREISIEILT